MTKDRFLFNKKYTRIDRVIVVFLLLIFSVSFIFRVIGFENLPGIHGDEAWYGVEMIELLRGSTGFGLRYTETGNLLNPFHSGLVLFFQYFFEPSFWILRIPALITGLLYVVAAFLLMKKITNFKVALVMSVLVAVLPHNIAHSRYGYDVSQITFFTFLTMYFALRGQLVRTGLSFVASVVVHPTSVFVLPVLMCSLVGKYWFKLKSLIRRHWFLILISSLSLIAVLLLWVSMLRGVKGLWSINYDMMLGYDRLYGLLIFVKYFGRLFTGFSMYEEIVGIGDSVSSLIFDILFWIVFLLLVFRGVREFIKKRRTEYIGMGIGLIIALVIFYMATGLRGIVPITRRYAFWSFSPTLMLVVFCLGEFIEKANRFRIIMIIISLVGFILLGSFASNYFGILLSKGGGPYLAYRTADVEPKQQAYSIVLADAVDDYPVTVLAGNWRLYWPLRYLSYKDGLIVVEHFKDKSELYERMHLVMDNGGYLVVFSGEKLNTIVEQEYSGNLQKWQIKDYGGKDLISVWRLKREKVDG